MTRAPDPPWGGEVTPQWAAEFVRTYNQDIPNLLANSQQINTPYRIPTYSVSALTSSAYSIKVPRPLAGNVVFASGVSGAATVLQAYGDGTRWRLTYNNAPVS